MAYPFLSNHRPASNPLRSAVHRSLRNLPTAPSRPTRKMLFEPLEPRVLLSADSALPGVMNTVEAGFQALYTELEQMLAGDDLFETYVPGFLTQIVKGDGPELVSPTFAEALTLNDIVGDQTGGVSDLASRFRFLDGIGDGFWYDDVQKLRVAWDVFDINDDGSVSVAEAFGVLVLGQIQDYIENTEVLDSIPDPDVEDFAVVLTSFINNVGGTYFLNDNFAPEAFDWLFDIKIGADYKITANGDLQFSLQVTMAYSQMEQLDLGYQADELGITLNPGEPPTPGAPFELSVKRTVAFDNLIFGFEGAASLEPGDTLLPGDFYVAIPDGMRIGLEMDGKANGMELNIGFLGTTVIDDPNYTGYKLDMFVDGFALDPSNPGPLGFETYPVVASDGTITAPNDTSRFLQQDVQFSLKVGELDTSTYGEITVPGQQFFFDDPNTPEDEALISFVALVQGAVDAALPANLVTVSEVDGKLKFSLPESDPTVAGFSKEAFGPTGTLTAADVPLGTTNPPSTTSFSVPGYSFLLRVGDDIRLVTVEGLVAEEIEIAGEMFWVVTTEMFQDKLQDGLDAAFAGLGGSALTAGVSGGKLQIERANTELEITGTLTLDYVNKITIEEMARPGNIFQLTPDADSSFEVGLKVRANEGLEYTGTDDAYRPEGTIAVAKLDPFNQGLLSEGGDVEAVTISVVPQTGEPVVKVRYDLVLGASGEVDGDGNSTDRMLEMLDFNVLGTSEILGILNQLGVWLDRAVGTELFTAFDLPFADASLAEILFFGDMVRDQFLIDDGDDGLTRPGSDGVPDKQRLLRWVSVDGEQQLVPMFTNAQQLEARLAEIGVIILGERGIALTDDQKNGFRALLKDAIDGSYDPVSQELTYNLDTNYFLNEVTNLVPQAQQDKGIPVPLDFDLDLAPLGALVTDGKVLLNGDGQFTFTLGIKLGDAASPLSFGDPLDDDFGASLLVEDLNNGRGVALNTNLALTSLLEIDPIVGRLTANAIFTVALKVAGEWQEPVEVKILRNEQLDENHPDYGRPFTSDNLSFGDLLTDLNDALALAGLGTKVQAVDAYAGTDERASGRVVLIALDDNIEAFQVNASSGNAAFTQLGLQPQSAATAWVLAPQPMMGPIPLNDPNDPNSSVVNVSFEIAVQRAGEASADAPKLVTVRANPIPGNDSWTSNNTTLSDLVNDVNAALRAAGLGDDIVAGRSGNSIAFYAVSNDVQGFTILPGSSADRLGLSEAGARDRLQGWGVDTTGGAFDDPITAGVVLRAQDVADNPFGRLAGDLGFSLVLTPSTGATETVSVNVGKTKTATNASILDLVRDLNEALQTGALDGRVVAGLDGPNIIFRALDPSIAGIKITGLDAAESAALGFQENAEVKADLKVIANRAAPVSFGVTGDTSFKVIVDGPVVNETLYEWDVTITEAVTLANRSLFDLAADINEAMNSGFVEKYRTPFNPVTVNDNPLVAVVQGDRIVIGLKTVEAGGGSLVGTLTPAAAEVTGFKIEAAGDSKAATELGLVPTGSGPKSQLANPADFIVQFSDGTSAAISLDALAGPDNLLSNDKNLADLRAAIQTQVQGQVGDKLAVELRADGSGLVLREIGWTSGGAEFRVIAVNGSPAALQLGILAADTTQLDLGQFDAADAGKPDGLIIGASIATLDILDRVFLQDPVLAANISVTTDGVVSAEANFGFVGVRLESGDNQELFGASIDVPFITGANDRVDLNTLFSNLGQPSNLWEYIELPEVALTSSANFAFKMSVIPDDSLGDLFQGVPVTASVQFTLPAILGELEKYYAGTEILPGDVTPADFNAARLVPATVSVAPLDAGPLADFADLAMQNVIDALNQVSQFLKTFADFDFLGETLLLLGVSINDLLDVAGRFDQAIETIQLNPAGGLQALAQSLRQGFNLPDFANEDERDAWFAARGIPDPGALIGFALTSLPGVSGLRVDLRLPVAFNESRAIDLDLGPVLGAGFGPLSLLGGAGLGVSGYLDTRLSFGIGLEADPDVYLFDEVSGISGALTARADNLAFNAAIGPLGVFVRDGQAQVNLGFGFGQDIGGAPDQTSVQSLADLIDNNFAGFKPSFNGDILANLPLFFPSDSVYLDDISLSYTGLSLDPVSFAIDPGVFDLDIPDLSDIDFDLINPFGSIPLMLDAFDLVLQTLQDLLDGEVFGLQLPLVGDQLSSGADFIDKLRRDVLSPIRQFVEQAPEMGLEIMQALLYSLLGPGSAGVEITVGGSPILLKTFLGLDNDFDGLGLLVDYTTGDTVDDDGNSLVSMADVVPWKADGADDFSWRFRLGQEYTPSVAIGFDLGFPGLGLALDTGLDVKINWDLALGLGISPTDGAYLLVGDHGDDMGDVEFKAGIKVRLPDGSTLDGRLGFLQIIAESNDTYFSADFELDITNGGDSDVERLSFFQFGALDADVTLKADAEVDLELVAQFNRSLLPDTIAALLPSLQADFLLSWSTGDLAISAGEFDFAGHLEKLGFENVSLDMGSFLGDFLGPVVNKISEITGPIQPIIDVFTAPIPLVSDLAGRPVTLLDIAAQFGKVDTGMIYALADIITLVNQIAGISADDELLVPIGDFTLFDKTTAALNDGNFAQALSLPTFNFATWGGEGGENFKSFIEDTGQLVSDFAGLLDSSTGSGKTKDLSQGLLTGTAPGAGQFSFPLFDNPWLAFGLLIGQDVSLVEYDLPPFGVDFTYVQKFPIWGPLFARLSGSIGLTVDLAFGYDTRGVRDFAEGNFSNPLDLLAGFYVNDTDQPGGTGTDVPEVILRGEIFAGAELNLGIASAGVEGGIILTINFDLYDPDRDGKVRINELVGNFLYEFRYGSPALAPLAIFDVFGDIALQLRAFIEILFFEASFEITPPITLVEFSIEFDREPILATERGDGSLLLNIGPNSMARLNGDTRDIAEEIYVRSLSASEVEVWAPGLGVSESAAQSYRIGADKLILAYGGDGNDLIDLSGVTHNIRYFVDAGAGDDNVLGTQAGGEMYGGLGNDVLIGGAGDDFIVGGFGNDYIFGNGGQNVLIGDNGRRTAFELTLPNNTTVDMLRYNAPGSSDDGDDVIIGGDGADIIIGGGGYDLVFGAGGGDLILGDGGYFEGRAIDRGIPLANGFVDISQISTRGAGAPDRIYGGAGDDTILGGSGDDFIEGGSGQDLISGGTGKDVIYGGEGSDWLFGDEGDDIIFGGRDPFDPTGFGANPAASPDLAPLLAKFGKGGPTVIDAITAAVADGTNNIGNTANNIGSWSTEATGNDYIEGGDGNDFIRGQGGNDTIHGNRGNDIIFGDEGTDTIGAGFMDRPWLTADAQQPYNAEAGADIIFGGADGDVIDGGTGADIVFGDDGLVVYLGFAPTGNVDGLRAANERGSLIRSNGTDRFIGDGDESALIPAGYSHDGLWSTPDLYVTQALATDGNDSISGGDGDDIIFGGGGNDTMFGDFDPAEEFFGPRPTGQDVIIGDGGRVELSQRRFAAIQTLSSIPFDGDDIISGNDGSDYIFGGGGEDTIYGFHADLGTYGALVEGVPDNDVIFGDNGRIQFNPTERANRITKMFTLYDGDGVDSGASDTVFGQFGNDVIFGGLNSAAREELSGGLGDDIIIGDQGEIEFETNPAAYDTAIWVSSYPLKAIRSYADNLGGVDYIYGEQGSDILIGGTAGDFMYGDDPTGLSGGGDDGDGGDIMLGDNGEIIFSDNPGRLTAQVAAMPGPAAVDRIRTTDVLETTGGADFMFGNAGADIMFGGVNNGGFDRMWGDRDGATPANLAQDGDDVLVGDNGEISFVFANADRTTLDLIRSYTDKLGGTDYIYGQAAGDVALGGTGDDFIFGDDEGATAGALDGDDILLGDNGDIHLVAVPTVATGDLRVVLGSTVIRIVTTDNTVDESSGGADEISGNAGSDILIGGVNDGGVDFIYGDRAAPTAVTLGLDRDDLVLGDNGDIRFKFVGTRMIVESIVSFTDGLGGTDFISGHAGGDLAIGGTGDDFIFGDNDAPTPTSLAEDGNDVLIGDNAEVLLDAAPAVAPGQARDLRTVFTSAIYKLQTTDFTHSTSPTGGVDVIAGNAGDDIILGGVEGDYLYGDTVAVTFAAPGDPGQGFTALLAVQSGADGADIMLGDNGALEWRSTGRLGEVPGIDIAQENAGLAAHFATGADTDLTTLDLITTEQPTNGGRDWMWGGDGSDVMFGGTDSDTMFGDNGFDGAGGVGDSAVQRRR
jgi:Ca2+-binding RTX toxin-like protein